MAASNKFILQRNGITHILQVASGMYPKFPGKFVYKTINIDDLPSCNLKQHFATCHRFIEQATAQGGTVLVHCWAGVSRSATIVITYLMQKHGISMMQATDLVRQQRWFINPNPGFKTQMKRWEREISSQAHKPQQEESKIMASGNAAALPILAEMVQNARSMSTTYQDQTRHADNVLRQNQLKVPSMGSPLITQNKMALTEKPSVPRSKGDSMTSVYSQSPQLKKGSTKTQRQGSQPPNLASYQNSLSKSSYSKFEI